jgi:hypothetical protein
VAWIVVPKNQFIDIIKLADSGDRAAEAKLLAMAKFHYGRDSATVFANVI